MYKIISLVIMLITFLALLTSCSGHPKQIKQDIAPLPSQSEIPVVSTERELKTGDDKFNVMTFPLFTNPAKMESWIHDQVINLHRPIELFKEVHGYYPDSMSSFVQSGLPLTWPRNLIDGTPIKCITGRNLTPDASDWAAFKYQLIGSDSFMTQIVSLDKNFYEQTGNESWLVRDVENSLKLKENQRRRSVVTMGTRSVAEVPDDNNKRIFAMCGILLSFLNGRTHAHYYATGELPNSFDDLLDNRLLIIRENFFNFAQALKNSDAIFKWGVDHNKNCVYSILDIDGERYISYCVRFGTVEESPQTSGLKADCSVYDLDMSSPIVSNENITNLVIPNEYLISIKDIPLNAQ